LQFPSRLSAGFGAPLERLIESIPVRPSSAAGTPAQNFEILDLNADGNRYIQLRFSTAALIVMATDARFGG
jgi:hypothetical protein